MPEFLYKARDSAGMMAEGVVEAATVAEASTTLADRNLTVVSLVSRAKKSIFESSLKIFSSIKSREVVVFSRQLSVLVAANISIVQALHTVSRQTTQPKLRAIIGEIANEVEAGSRLSDALGKYPKVFSPFYINMIRSGETSGRVEEVLTYLADQLEKDYDLVSRVKGSMYYPAFIIVGMVVAGFVMMTFVVPKLTAVLTETGAALPWTTQLLVNTSGFFVNFWWEILLIAASVAAALGWYLRTPEGHRFWGSLALNLPIFGGIFKRLAVVRMVRSMRTLLEGGVDTVTALEIAADVVGNDIYHDLILQTAKEVRDGRPLSTVFAANTKVVPSMVSQMMAVGEETGKLTEILDRLGSFYSREIDNLVGGLVTLIEPIIIVIIGLAVAVMVAAIILPMYTMSQSF